MKKVAATIGLLAMLTLAMLPQTAPIHAGEPKSAGPAIIGPALRPPTGVEIQGPTATETAVCGSNHTTPTAGEQTVITLTNQLRASHGVAALALSASLERSADTHSLQMAQTGLFAHDSYGNTLARTQSCGSPTQSIDENIAGNQSGDPTATFQQYVNSPEHLQNLLDPSMKAVGVSFETGIYNDGTTTWQPFVMNTMTFASTADSGAPQPTPAPSPSPTPQPGKLAASLSAPAGAAVGQPIAITVGGSGASVPYYSTSYGDGASGAWQQSGQFSHAYAAAGAYIVTAWIGDGANGAISAPVQRSIVIGQTPTPSPTPAAGASCSVIRNGATLATFSCP